MKGKTGLGALRIGRIITISRFRAGLAGTLLLAVQAIWAQGTSDEISGAVRDTSGTPIENATIAVTDARQFPQSTVLTGTRGQFAVQGLRPGTYELLVAYRGFSPLRMAASIPQPEARNLNLVLGLPALAEEVTADLGLVQKVAQTAQRVNVVDEIQLEERASTPRA